METIQVNDIRRYLSKDATVGGVFDIKISGGSTVARGEWINVQEKQVEAKASGKIPNWVPEIGGKDFSVTVVITLLNGNKAKVKISDSISGEAEGTLYASGDELKIQKIEFTDPLGTVSEISLTRWKNIETRASFYSIPYTSFWFESWWVPVELKSNDYPSPRI